MLTFGPSFSLPGHVVLEEGDVLRLQAEQVEEGEGAVGDHGLEAGPALGPHQVASAEVGTGRGGLKYTMF